MEGAKTFLNPDYSEITAFKTFSTVGKVEGGIQQWMTFDLYFGSGKR